MPTFSEVIGALSFLGAEVVLGFVVVTHTGDAANLALGALIALTSAGAGFFLRSKLAPSGVMPAPSPAPVVAVAATTQPQA